MEALKKAIYKGSLPGKKAEQQKVEPIKVEQPKPEPSINRREEELLNQLRAEKRINKALMVLNAELRDEFRVFMEKKK